MTFSTTVPCTFPKMYYTACLGYVARLQERDEKRCPSPQDGTFLLKGKVAEETRYTEISHVSQTILTKLQVVGVGRNRNHHHPAEQTRQVGPVSTQKGGSQSKH